MEKIRVLFLSANPDGTHRLQLDEEIREIDKKIRQADAGDKLELISQWAVRPDDLLLTLDRYRPDIVHFSGHGNPSDEIYVKDSQGKPKPISKEKLTALFTTLRDNIRLVFLNTCYSKSQAEAIVGVIDCAVGMKRAIGDKAAITFAAAFYRALGFGRSVQEAFEQGRIALLLEGIPEENTPELLSRRDINPSRVILVRRTD